MCILTFLLLKCRLILFNPITTKKQYPALGSNKVLSAITKPTMKNKLQAGRKGSRMSESPITCAFLKELLKLEIKIDTVWRWKEIYKQQFQ